MAVDMFLKITDIKGESTDAKHKDEIDIESFSWGATQQGTTGGAGGGGGAGKVSMQDFHFVMRTSKASPKLFLAVASGQHIKEAVLTARKAGGNQIEFLKIKFTDILVSSYQQASSADSPTPNDSFSLNFAKIEVQYTPSDPSGKADAPITAGWDLTKNTKL
ncbi:MAG TPA: type VI secretion system tube protein Hcp [Acidimicrobiales bacterium]|jgi:type VI secretion system secreted protein Hcp|nr:type VI secretion system tube protein Hcp [Acidimicrobiales bacterium]